MKPTLQEVPSERRKYMVHVIGGGNPTKVHETLVEAAAEAVRLTEKLGRTSFVMESIGIIQPARKPKETSS